MKKIKLHFYFWFISLFFIALSLYLKTIEDAFIDINIHDTYYVIHKYHLSILLAIVYTLIGVVYFIFSLNKIVSNSILTKIHSAISLGIVPLYFIGYSITEPKTNARFPLFDDNSNLEYFVFTLGLLFVTAQLLFIFNVIFSLFKFFYIKK